MLRLENGRPILDKPQQVEQVTFEEIQGRDETEKMQWLKDYVVEMSKKRKRWDNLLTRFPKGNWMSDTIFVADNGIMERYFNKKGYEVAQRKYDPQQKYPWDTIERNFSEYDQDGYLIEYSHYGTQNSGIAIRPGYIRWFDYREKSDGSKELISATTQELSMLGLYPQPTRLLGNPHCIDFVELLGDNYPPTTNEVNAEQY